MKKLLIIMLGVFIFTPLSLKAVIYDSNDEPISDLRFYTLNEVFNKVERPLSNYIITQDPNFDILNYTNFIGLNGHSLREVFEKNKISDDFIINSISDSHYTINNLFTNNDYIIIINGKIDIRYQPYAIRFRNNSTDVSSIVNPTFNNEYNNVFFKLEPNDIPNNLYFLRNYIEDTNLFVDYIYAIDLSMFTVELTIEQMDYWFSVYQNPNLLNGLEIIGSNELFFYKDTIFNISKMKADKIFSPALYTFENMTEEQMLSQFEQWEYRDFNKVEVLSYNDYLFFNPNGSLQSMLSYYDNYNLNLKNVEISINEIDKNEIIILLIALVAYIIGVIVSIYFRNNVLFAGSSLLWFIPVFMIPNMFIITFSIIMIIMSFVITFYNNKEEGFN